MIEQLKEIQRMAEDAANTLERSKKNAMQKIMEIEDKATREKYLTLLKKAEKGQITIEEIKRELWR